MFDSPKAGSIKKKSPKMSGYPPETPDMGFKSGMNTGHPAAKNTQKIVKPNKGR